MKKITSFQINHNLLSPGIYISRVDDNIITYDLRFLFPNMQLYLSNPGLHTIEHLGATFLRNSCYQHAIIYFGPMGCRTGFYLLVKEISPEIVINLVKEMLEFIICFSGPIPGATKKECGNYLEHSLLDAKKYGRDFLEIIKNYAIEQLDYVKENVK